jgi:D-3-phosphoglycerate dehydrogenase
MGHLFAISRSLNDSYKNMEHGDFSALKKKYAKGVELRGKTIGIIGFGRIGKSLASYAIGCGMNVVAIDRTALPVKIQLELGNEVKVTTEITPVNNLSSVISSLDFISIHVPKQADGSAVSGKTEFEAMKKGVRIVNAARGGVINEDDLLVAIANGTVAGCALDVFENEPTPRKELLSNEKIACTPHVGAATLEAQDRIGEELASLIIEAFGKK